MFVDDLREFNLYKDNSEKNNINFNDAIIFDVENIYDSTKLRFNMHNQPFPSKLPYENIILNNSCAPLWIFSEEKNEKYILYFTSIRKDFYRKNKHSLHYEDRVLESMKIECSYVIELDNISLKVIDARYIDEKRTEHDYSDNDWEKIEINCIIDASLIYHFLLFLSCRNVRASRKSPDKKIQKKREKTGKKPLVSFYVLEVESTKSETTEKSKSQGKWTNRVHLCRGHVKHYSKEKPHVSGFVGNMWCPPHIKGDKSKGEIVKEYSIKG